MKLVIIVLYILDYHRPEKIGAQVLIGDISEHLLSAAGIFSVQDDAVQRDRDFNGSRITTVNIIDYHLYSQEEYGLLLIASYAPYGLEAGIFQAHQRRFEIAGRQPGSHTISDYHWIGLRELRWYCAGMRHDALYLELPGSFAGIFGAEGKDASNDSHPHHGSRVTVRCLGLSLF